MTNAFVIRRAKQVYLTYIDPAIWLQHAAKLTDESVIVFLRHLVAKILWSQNLLILKKLSAPRPS
jgi:hypothetical protein